MFFSVLPASAKAADVSSTYREIVCDDTIYYVETIITELPGISTYATGPLQHKTATKTDYYRDANNNVLWSVSITATFYYDGESAACTSCSHQASAPASTWNIKSVSSSSSGNSATATATATQTLAFGITKDVTRSVTIYCSPTGTIY